MIAKPTDQTEFAARAETLSAEILAKVSSLKMPDVNIEAAIAAAQAALRNDVALGVEQLEAILAKLTPATTAKTDGNLNLAVVRARATAPSTPYVPPASAPDESKMTATEKCSHARKANPATPPMPASLRGASRSCYAQAHGLTDDAEPKVPEDNRTATEKCAAAKATTN